jgi:single-strand DNA-binding protein
LAAQYLQKGRLVLIEGDVDARVYTDRDGNPRASLDLTATNLKFLGSRGEGGEQPAAVGGPAHVDEFPTHEDDIPF